MRLYGFLVTLFVVSACQSVPYSRVQEVEMPELTSEPAVTATPDPCCAHWMADGKCAHEMIPGCSAQ